MSGSLVALTVGISASLWILVVVEIQPCEFYISVVVVVVRGLGQNVRRLISREVPAGSLVTQLPRNESRLKCSAKFRAKDTARKI